MAARMKRSILVTALLLAGLTLALVPTASADHCAEYPLYQEVKCIAYEEADNLLWPVNCLYNTPPSQWFTVCIVLW